MGGLFGIFLCTAAAVQGPSCTRQLPAEDVLTRHSFIPYISEYTSPKLFKRRAGLHSAGPLRASKALKRPSTCRELRVPEELRYLLTAPQVCLQTVQAFEFRLNVLQMKAASVLKFLNKL